MDQLTYLNMTNAQRAEHDAQQHCIDRSRASPASVPEGFKLVPVEPTPEMIDKVIDERLGALVYGKDHNFIDIYRAMLAAVPTPPVSEDRKDAERWRWLREQHQGNVSPWYVRRSHVIPTDLDAAIDAAMQEDKP